MYNTDLPRRADLPSSGQLLRSTIIAAIAATAILTTVVLPAEYAVDPTGIGRQLGLTQMGEIKVQLAQEAAQDEATVAAAPPETAAPSESAPVRAVAPADQQQLAERLDQMDALLAQIQTERIEPVAPGAVPVTEPAALDTAAAPAEPEEVIAASSVKSDEISITLAPGEGAEVKLEMRGGAQANYRWSATGEVNFDAHGDGGGRSISYEKGRGVPADQGVLEAAFDGNHGWFWRNRGEQDVTLTLQTSGDYIALKRLI